MNEKILAFLPAFTCEAGIARVLAQFQGPVARRFHEVLVLDDHSADATLETAIAAAELCEIPRVTVGLNWERYGPGGSLKAAFAYARGGGFTHLAVLPGDDNGDIMDLATVLSQGLHRRYDACLGARFAPGAKLEGHEPWRALGNRVVNALASVATRRHVRDLGMGPSVFALSAIDDSALAGYPDDARFGAFALLDLIDRGHSIRFFPIHWREAKPAGFADLGPRGLPILAILAEFAAPGFAKETAVRRDRPTAGSKWRFPAGRRRRPRDAPRSAGGPSARV